jgi:hypothetical protein
MKILKGGYCWYYLYSMGYTLNVTNIRAMFLKTYNGGSSIGNWNTSKVTTMNICFFRQVSMRYWNKMLLVAELLLTAWLQM